MSDAQTPRPEDFKISPESQGSPEEQLSSASAAAGEAGVGEAAPNPAEEIARLRAELAEAQEQVVRAQAELENFRKRTHRQAEQDRKYAILPIVRDFLPAFDNLDRAIASAEQHEQAAGLLEGVKMVSDQLLAVLSKYDCRPIEAAGETFDPNHHEALAHQPSDDRPAGAVLGVVQRGYQLHDRVIRPAQVFVSSGPASSPEEPE